MLVALHLGLQLESVTLSIIFNVISFVENWGR